jgi:hypothetical protein
MLTAGRDRVSPRSRIHFVPIASIMSVTLALAACGDEQLSGSSGPLPASSNPGSQPSPTR